MTTKNILKGTLFLVLLVAVVAYITYVVLNMPDGNPKEKCTEVSLVVEENPNASFIDKQTVERLLQQAQLYPIGRLMSDIDTRQIEEALRKNNFIASVECYKTNNGMSVGKGKVCVKVTQRTPVIYVIPEGKNGYYVDTEGMIITPTSYTHNIITATGKIPQDYATSELKAFGNYILEHPFWDKMIEQIYVDADRKGRPTVTLIPRLGDHTIYLGTLDKLDTKLRRLQVFYEKGFPQVGWNKYSRLNLEYDNQIVCTRH